MVRGAGGRTIDQDFYRLIGREATALAAAVRNGRISVAVEATRPKGAANKFESRNSRHLSGFRSIPLLGEHLR